MASKYDMWMERSLYECQMFGFTSKAFMDFVYNVISKVSGEALIEIDKQIGEQPELSSLLDEDMKEKCFAKIKETFGKKLDINVDRLEMFSRHNTFRIPRNVTLPCDKIQESCRYTKEDEDCMDQRIDTVIKEIKASYEMRIAIQKELTALSKLETMADQVLGNMNEVSINEKDLQLACSSVQNLTDLLKSVEEADPRKNSVDVSTIAPVAS